MTKNLNQPNILLTRFEKSLAAVEALEKQVNKVCLKFVAAALTPELSKCLSPESTDSPKHLQRIKLIKTSIGLKSIKTDKSLVLHPLRLKKTSEEQDLDIIVHTLLLQGEKIAHYQMLHPLAMVMHLQIEASLLEQTITDNRNTDTWLRQIVQNIIAQSVLAKTSD